jgi:hypothetical protein
MISPENDDKSRAAVYQGLMVVDRAAFIAWCSGVLLERDGDGKCVVGDHVNHPLAEAALERGEEVGLMVDGKLFSKLVVEGGEVVEKML